MVNRGVLTVAFWASKIFLGFWIYFGGFPFWEWTERGGERFGFPVMQKAMPARGRAGMAACDTVFASFAPRWSEDWFEPDH